jgi:hypothetical protein
VYIDTDISAKLNKPVKRKIYIWKKAYFWVALLRLRYLAMSLFFLVLLALSKLLFFRLVICFTVRLIRGWLNLDDDILDGTDACGVSPLKDSDGKTYSRQ